MFMFVFYHIRILLQHFAYDTIYANGEDLDLSVAQQFLDF